MKKHVIFLIFVASFFRVISQNIKIMEIIKIYYYKTTDDFFNDKKDSIVGDNIVYDYGKVSFTDRKTNKKVKFHLHKDSLIFAFKIIEKNNNVPVYAISKGEKRYGIYLGGSKNLFCVFYSRGNLYLARYDSKNYIYNYYGTIDEFGYYLVFTKKDFESEKNGDIEYFIKDKEELYKKYVDERTNTTTYNWDKNYILKQVEYLRAYNN